MVVVAVVLFARAEVTMDVVKVVVVEVAEVVLPTSAAFWAALAAVRLGLAPIMTLNSW